MKIPTRILGLLALATPLITGCGSDESDPTNTNQDVTSAESASAEEAPKADEERAPSAPRAPAQETAPATRQSEETAPRVRPASDVPVTPFIGPPGGSTSSPQEPCPACGMG
jgi:hypothetical protein